MRLFVRVLDQGSEGLKVAAGDMGFLDKFSGFIVGGFEKFFYWYGKKVSTYPWYFLLGCLLGSGLCGIGLISFSEETNAFKLWVPSNSDFVANNEWLQQNFPPDTRFNNILISAPNVLTPEVLLQVRISSLLYCTVYMQLSHSSRCRF